MCPWNSFNFIQYSPLKDREKLFTLEMIKVKRYLFRQFSQNSTFYRVNENVEFGVFRHFWLIIQVGMKVPFVCTTAWTSLSADFWNFSQPHFCRKNRICRWVWALKIGGIVRPDFPREIGRNLTTDQTQLTENGLLAPSNYAIVSKL